MVSIIDTLKKLIAHEKSARTVGSVAEAEAFASRIQELLTKYKLSITEVEAEFLDAKDPIGMASVESRKVKNDVWYLMLAVGVANNFYCKAIDKSTVWQKGYRRNKAEIIFIGRASDREAAISMFGYLAHIGGEIANKTAAKIDRSETIAAFRAEMRENRISSKLVEGAVRDVRTKYREDFLLGFSYALNSRLENNRLQLEVGASTVATGLIQKDALAIAQLVGSLPGSTNDKTISLKPPTYKGAFLDGYSAGTVVRLKARASLGSGD